MSKARILIVEDELIVAKDIQVTLQIFGYDVPEIVSSGGEAIQAAYRLNPELIMMDIMIKGSMDGVEAAEMIRSQFNIPVIYLTAYSDDETLRRAKLTESYGFVSKPFEEKELYVAIEFALYKHQLHSKVMEQASWMEALLRSFPEAFLALDRDQRVAFINPQGEKTLGVTEAEIKGRPIGDFVSVPLLSGGVSGEQSLDWQGLSGSRLPLLVRQQPINDAKGLAQGQLLLFRLRAD